MPDDVIKTAPEVVHLLTQTLGGDGNLLLNIGPEPTGAIEPRQVEVLREVGAWVRRHAASIYGTRGGPFLPGAWGASTCDGATVTLFVAPAVGATLRMPTLPATLTGCVDAETGATVATSVVGSDWELSLPTRDDGFPRVIRMTLDQEAFGLVPVLVD